MALLTSSDGLSSSDLENVFHIASSSTLNGNDSEGEQLLFNVPSDYGVPGDQDSYAFMQAMKW